MSRKIGEEESLLCRKCSLLKCDLAHQIYWTQEESLSRKVACRSASSRARLSYMSPGSQAMRMLNAKMKRDSEAIKGKKYDESEVPLSNEQDEEMNQGLKENVRMNLASYFMRGINKDLEIV